MNQTFDIEKYIISLPQNVQDFVGENEWQNRAEEVAKKYSLSPEQTESLTNDTLLILVGISNPDDFEKTLIEDLGVSQLKSEQIVSDLEKRVFEYALSFTEEKKAPTSEPKPILSFVAKNNPQIPEIRPQNLPAKESNILDQQVIAQKASQLVTPDTVTSNTSNATGYRPTSSIPANIPPAPAKPLDLTPKKDEDWLSNLAEKPFIGKDFGGSKITYKPNESEKKLETLEKKPLTSIPTPIKTPIQPPIQPITPSSIPKYTPEPVKEMPKPTPNIISSKMDSTTTGKIEKTVGEAVIDQTKKYGADPYREPIE